MKRIKEEVVIRHIVTVTKLDAALRLCDIEINKTLLKRILDVIKAIEAKGSDTNIKDLSELRNSWGVKWMK